MNYETNDLIDILSTGEEILWRGKPKKTPFCLNKFIRLLPFAIIWLLFDVFFIATFIIASGGLSTPIIVFFVIFFGLHLLPVWKTVISIITAGKRWQNEEYIVTNKRILIQSGLIGMDYDTFYYKDISDVRLDVGVVESMSNVGNIIMRSDTRHGGSFLAIENPKEVYRKIQKIVLDIQTDVYYPNALRPEENTGYNTKYRG